MKLHIDRRRQNRALCREGEVSDMNSRDDIVFRLLQPGDFESSMSLWMRTPGVGLRSSDNPISFRRFIERNPLLNFAAVAEGKIVATVLCGQDGRRGYIYHLAVDDRFRRCGIGSGLVNLSLAALRAEDIDKCTLFIFADNLQGEAFWKGCGWTQRDDLLVFQKDVMNSDS